MASTFKKKNTQCILSIGDLSVPIQGSFQRLEQVVLNLLQNADDALQSNYQSITLTLKTEDPNRIALTITDTGIGIGPDDLLHVTELFFTTKGLSGGTGVGLSVSQNIVNDHHGQLLFESEIGKGTSVQLILPRSQH